MSYFYEYELGKATKIFKAGLFLVRKELPDEYSYIWEEL